MRYFQEHPKIATVIVIAVGTAVVVLLYVLSVVNPPSDATKRNPSIVAHGDSGRQAAGGEHAGGEAALDSRYADLVDESEGQVLENVIEVDIDSDGTMETLVLVRGAGDARPLDWYLFRGTDGSRETLFVRTMVAQGELVSEGPRLMETEGVYSEDDERCCPSQEKRTIYVWKDGSLVVSRVEAAPGGAPAP